MNKKVVTLLLFCTLCVAGAFAQGRKGVCINEVMVQNDSSYIDDYGRYNAWIELYNSTFAPVEISTMYLTDDKNNPTKYPVPRMDVNTEIPARQHVIFWADNEPNKGTFHLNFLLNPGEENWIGLYDSDGITLIDEVTVPAGLVRGYSYARIQDGIKAADDAEAWEVRDGSDEKYITPSSNNVIVDTNDKIDDFQKHDGFGLGMTVLAMFVVFSSLLVLCLCFYVIGRINKKVAERKKIVAVESVDSAAVPVSVDPDSGEEIAAICMALHEHFNMHDKEDFVLTINKVKRTYSPWSSKIYSLRELPRK